MSVGTPFHERTAAVNRKMQWREWSGYFAAGAYSDHHDIEYNAIREAAALIDVSPLYKYLLRGPEAVRLIDRVITRDATKLRVGQVYYTSWCDEDGKVIDDGTVTRLEDTTYRWTAADPSLRWIRMNAGGLDVDVEEVTESTAALAVQGPLSRSLLEAATGEALHDLRYFRGRPAVIGEGLDVYLTRTGYTGDLGYEVWVDAGRAVELWDALQGAGAPYGARPAGMLALDVARVEAGLILLEVDYTSSRHAVSPEQAYSPYELGVLGMFVDFRKETNFVGRRALELEQARGGPDRRLVGLDIEWADIERLNAAHGLPPEVPAAAWRTPIPVFDGPWQVGRATSGTWSPTLKRNIALASVPPRYEPVGTRLTVEWTVEARRGRAHAVVTPIPFFDPPRKRA